MNIKHYLSPRCDYFVAPWEELLCASPVEGGLEDVEYEDWVTQG